MPRTIRWLPPGPGCQSNDAADIPASNGRTAGLRDAFVLEDMSGIRVARIKESALQARTPDGPPEP